MTIYNRLDLPFNVFYRGEVLGRPSGWYWQGDDGFGGGPFRSATEALDHAKSNSRQLKKG